jgi:dihydrofolate reductase
MPKISIVAAVAENYAIGKADTLPWRLPADMKHFKNLTSGHAVVMGKRTFYSLPNGPLPNRKNIVLTSILSEGIVEGYYEADSLEDAVYLCEKEEEVFIIGGATVYKQCIDKVDTMYITWVHAEFAADTFFPEVDFSQWNEVSRERHESDDQNSYSFTFSVYERKK